ncbi:sarcosine oxidase subunit alpha [Lentibacillus halodurans]|uniref:Sarcosine oxidase subunit alpha n=1 Tax=Lentibacillus halodurans TaxID=237679 RepID=A0A1I0W7W6_9BACI|nr:NAD(P)/FAD-dependent oxidoreductase [Lentibacillus halodurans]SFA84113.1 sarcosine oxidase subunit alpha [Lentibacillus halodurans]
MTYDLVVIGAGPAGMSAAIKAASYGADVAMVDENPVAGGKLLGQLHEEPQLGWWIGSKIAREIAASAQKLDIEFFPEKIVWGIFPHWKVMLHNGEELQADNVLIATGAAEKAIPIPGWTKPGVMAIGAAQTLTNYYRVKPGNKVAIIGVDPLSLAVAHELSMAGVTVAGIFAAPSNEFTSDQSAPIHVIEVLSRMSHLAPNRMLKIAGKMLKNPFMKNIAAKFYPGFGMNVWGIPLYLKKTVLTIEGVEQVEQIKTVKTDQEGQPKRESTKTVDVDCVCISGGLYPLSELVAAVGCEFVCIEELGGHIPLHSPEMETTRDGIFVAGNITGIEGAKVAMAQGELAGTTIIARLGLLENSRESIKIAQDKVEAARQHALIKFRQNIEYGREKSAQLWYAHKNK